MQENLSSELVLGTDFLADHGAVIDVRSNNVIFLPTELFPVSLSQKPIVCEAFASVIDQEIPLEELDTYNMAAFAVQPTQDMTIPFMDGRSLAVAEATSRNNNKLFFPGEYFENFNFLQKEKKRLSHFLFCKAFKAKKLKSD